ncbi:hypothetical protein [Paracoccus pacificus]|uniref:PH domain-containing protein n=1 Tax=Paracoccus pacificus TaxID=1463598 RepID=A0ABW4R8H0_9RHOB
MVIRAELRPWAEPAGAACAALAGLWLFGLGGWFFWPIGAALTLLALGWLVVAWRRMVFRRDVAAPGLVEIDESRIRYFGARTLGGEMNLRDLAEIRVMTLDGRLYWRLRSLDAQAMLIPLDAAGAAALPDAFAALPGASLSELARGLEYVQTNGGFRSLWRRPAEGGLT